MSISLRRSAIVVGLLLPQALAARAQTTTGAIQGFVRDSAGRPIELAEFRLFDGSAAPRFATSDSVGRFYFPGALQGEFRLSVRRVGYFPETLTVKVVSRETSRIDVIMAPSVSLLPEEVVHAASDPTRGKMGPFNRRKSRGVGSFITRAEIEKRQPASISELLRTLPGVNISQRMAGEPQPVHMQRSVNSSMQSTCVVQIYVDGQPYPNGNLDDFEPLTLEGVEVYRSASEIPADFRTKDATCGLISLWTRDPEAARRKP
jgi:hypothetical protein